MEQYESRHSYSLDACAISRERIVEELADVFDRYGFDRRDGERPPAETLEPATREA